MSLVCGNYNNSKSIKIKKTLIDNQKKKKLLARKRKEDYLEQINELIEKLTCEAIKIPSFKNIKQLFAHAT